MNDLLTGFRMPALAALLLMLSFPLALMAGDDSDGNDGRILFQEKCGNCHGPKGEGFRRVYPPIRNSRYLGEQLPQLPCIIRDGLSGEITVAGRVFNQAMPGDSRITDEEITLIIDFMLEEWGHKPLALDVGKWMELCPGPSERENRQ